MLYVPKFELFKEAVKKDETNLEESEDESIGVRPPLFKSFYQSNAVRST